MESRVSASIVFAAMQDGRRRARVPTFSIDGGVVLQPAYSRLLCAYGTDGSTDDGNGKAGSCAEIGLGCIPGCSEIKGGPPTWCERERPHDEGAWLTCGMGWGAHGVRPWRAADIYGPNGFLDLFARDGEPFEGVGRCANGRTQGGRLVDRTLPRIQNACLMCARFKGYNEVIVESDTWLRNLPLSVEAMFFVDCAEGDPNVQYSAADGHGPAGSCHEAKATAIAAHRAFLQAFRLDERRFPLLKLRPADWKAPFVIARSIDTVGT